MIKIIHYRRKCIGCAICQELQPALWRMSKKDGRATLLGASTKKEIHILATGASTDLSLAVARACPVNIIKISD